MIPERLAFIDLETTGANPVVDRVTEIGLVEVDGDTVSTWSTLVNPQRAIPEFIQRLTGIGNEMVADAPTFAEVAAELQARLHGRLFIAHNARFDYGFVRNEYLRLGQRFRSDVLCTVRLSRALFPQHHRHNLDSLIARHGLHTADRHRALADADLIWQFWRAVRAVRSDAEVDAAIRLQMQRPRLPPHLDAALVDDLPESPGVYLLYGEDDHLLYVGKGINLRQRILKHFAGDTREPRSVRLSEEVRRIDWRETIGDFGALLLESRLVRERRPLHNRRPRQGAEAFAWQLAETAVGDFRPRLVTSDDVDFGRAGDLYGLFASRREAASALRKIAEAYELCPAILGLEPDTFPGRACVAHQLRKCRGACCGKEAIGLHSARLMSALAKLRLPAWPYPGAVGLVESNAFLNVEEIHVIDAWRYLGAARSDAEVHELLPRAATAPFDIDDYKLLKAELARGKAAIRRL